MSRRLSKKRRKVTLAEAPLITDRGGLIDNRLPSLLRNAMVGTITVDEPAPEQAGDKIIAFRTLRDDVLARFHDRQWINEAQFKGGRAYQLDMERVEISGAKAIDTTKPAVDGGRFIEIDSTGYSAAVGRLKKLSGILGILGESILRESLGSHRTPSQVAERRGFNDPRIKEKYGWLFREGLEACAVFYGFAMRART